MLDLTKYILGEILEESDYDIQTLTEDDKTVFNVSVKKEKIGIIIGKGGHTIKAIQDILFTASKLKGEKSFIEVSEMQ